MRPTSEQIEQIIKDYTEPYSTCHYDLAAQEIMKLIEDYLESLFEDQRP